MTIYVLSGSATINYILNAGDVLSVVQGGVASGVTVNSGGVEILLSGGVDSGASVQGGGVVYVGSGGSAVGDVVSGGGELVELGGVVSGAVISGGIISANNTLYDADFEFVSFDENTTIYAGGVQYAASGTSGTLILSGGQQVLNAVEVVSAVVGAGGLQIVGFTIPTYARVLSALSLDTVVSGAGAGVIVDGVLPGPDEPDAGGETRSMTLVSGGFEIVSGGAFAEETTVAAGGYLVELPGADVIDPVLSGGTVVSSGVVLFNPYQPLKVDGLVASGLTVSSGGAEYVYYGGSETGGTVFGTQIVSKGTIYDVTVLSGGQTFLKGGGEQGFVASAVGITAGFGGQVWVEGATVIGCTVMDGGLLVANTLYAEQAGIDGLVIESGGSARIEDQISGEPTIAGGTLQLVADAYGANVALGAVSFSGAGGVLEVDAALTGTVYGFGLGDSVEIDLGDSSPDYGLIGTVAATIGAGNVLSATANGEVYTFHLDPDAIYSRDQILVSGTELTLEALCLCRGTRVAVPGGEVAVEDLRVGGVVETELGPRAVRWIGRRGYDGRFIAGNVLALPVCIKPGALGRGVPVRELFVSPGHGICVEGVLVPAWRLVNGVSVMQAEAVERVEYFHVELHGHGILFAEGAPVESYLEIGTRGLFQNFSEAPAALDGVTSCLPRVESGFGLRGIQARMDRRAGVVKRGVAKGRLRGFLDFVAPRVVGWAQDVSAPEEAVELEVLCQGRVAARALANAYRADVRAAGWGTGAQGFDVALPEGASGEVVVRRRRDEAVLAMAVRAAA